MSQRPTKKKTTEENVKELIMLCKLLGVEIPDELRERKPPQKEMDAMIKEVGLLGVGEEYHIEFPEIGMTADVLLQWTEDDYPDININQHSVMEKYMNNCTNFLFDFVEANYDEMHEILEEHILDSKEYTSFCERIMEVLSQRGVWEEDYEEFDWDSDILQRVKA